jgi:hypothetical protein
MSNDETSVPRLVALIAGNCCCAQWISWKGSTDVNQPGNYPTQFPVFYDVLFVDNTPGSRRGVAFWQADSLDYVWVFGGEGFDNATKAGYVNDFWRYLPYP